MGEEFDPRSVANLIIDARQLIGLETTNLELQKVAFFCFAEHLIRTRRRLMKGYFEAWKYGPVHPIIYRSFKQFSGDAISLKAVVRDPLTGIERTAPSISSSDARRTVLETVSRFSAYSAGELVDLSHVKNGPWYFTLKNRTLGLRITDDIIMKCSDASRRARFSSQMAVEGYSAIPGVRHYVEEPLTGS